MRTHTSIAVAAVLALAGSSVACNRSGGGSNANGSAATAPAGEGQPGNGSARLIAEHGGVVATSAGFTTEVVAQGGGKLLTYVRGPQGPVQDARVRVTLRNADGSQRPVAVAWDARESAYVGYAWGVEPGMKTVEVAVSAQENAPPQLVSSQVNIASVATPPPARYGGTVEIIGEYAVEMVPSRSGDVAFFVMDLQGNPVPSADVELPRVTVSTGVAVGAAGSAAAGAAAGGVGVAVPAAAGNANVAAGAAGSGAVNAGGSVAVAVDAPPPIELVPVREGDHFVARAPAGGATVFASNPNVGFDVDLGVRGRRWRHGRVGNVVVVPALPPTIAVPAAGGQVAASAGGAVAVPAGQGAGGVAVIAPAAPAANVVVPSGPRGTVNAVVAPPSLGVNIVPPQPPRFGVQGSAGVVAPGAAVVGSAQPAGGGVAVVAPSAVVGARVAAPPVAVVAPAQPAVVAPARPAGVVGVGVVAPAQPAGGAVVVAPAVPAARPAAGAVVAPAVVAPSGHVQAGVGVGVRVNVPPPPPPPSVHVQGGVHVGGSFGVH